MDDQLRGLVAASESVLDPLVDPPEASVQVLDDPDLHLRDQDLDLLLGADAAGFSPLSDLRMTIRTTSSTRRPDVSAASTPPPTLRKNS